MRELQFEDLLRQTLRREADALVLTLTTDVLERHLAERRRRSRTGRRWLAIAAVAALLLAGVAVAIVGSRVPPPNELVTPGPPVVLPETLGLLRDFPDATMRLEHAVGPADGPVDPNATLAPGSTPEPIEVGRVTFDGPFVIGIACLGQGELVIQVVSPRYAIPYTGAVAPCDGTPVISQYLAVPIDPASPGDAVMAVVSPGASWRLAIGELPASLVVPPDFGPVAVTPGWNVVSAGSAVLLADPDRRTGAVVAVPDRATQAALIVRCQGTGSLAITFGSSPATSVACDADGTTRRLEYPVSGGESISVMATGDRSGMWVLLAVEANAELATTYPTAPPLPDGLASIPYVAPDANVIGVGTLGSNRQFVLPIAGARPGQPSGELLPVAIHSESDGARLVLISIRDGAVRTTLAAAPAPAFIFDSWADATHDQVFYGIALESGFEFHRVKTNGQDDVVVATVPRDGQTGFSAALAADESILVVDVCGAGPACTRTVVDAASTEVDRVERPSDPICRIFGIVDGLLIGTSRAVCSEDSATALIAVPVAEGTATIVLPDVPRPEIGGSVVVATPDGPKVVFASSFADDGVPSITVIDVRTGTTGNLPRGTVGDPRLIPYAQRLPAGWLLLAAGGMGDFPWQRALDRPPPVLVNLVTDERIELVNLPHWVGSFQR